MACSSKILKHIGTGRGIAGLLCLLLLVAGAGLAAFLTHGSRVDTSALHALAESPKNASTMIPTVTKSLEPIDPTIAVPTLITSDSVVVLTDPTTPVPALTTSEVPTDAKTTVLPVTIDPAQRCRQLDTSEACTENEWCRWKEKQYKCEIHYTKTHQPG